MKFNKAAILAAVMALLPFHGVAQDGHQHGDPKPSAVDAGKAGTGRDKAAMHKKMQEMHGDGRHDDRHGKKYGSGKEVKPSSPDKARKPATAETHQH